jgi:hypothetical protein
LHQVGDLFELNVKLWCQKVKFEGTARNESTQSGSMQPSRTSMFAVTTT